MEMTKFKATLGSSLILITFNIYAISPVDKNIDKDNLQSDKFNKSCIGVESEKDKKRRLRRGKERTDIFVQMDSFTSYNKGFEEKMEKISDADNLVYLFASMGIVGVGLQTAFTPMLLGLCNQDAATENKCNYDIDGSDGSKIIIETKWKNALQYTMTQSVIDAGKATKRKKMTVSTELPNYWNGTMSLHDDDGSKSETSWSRSADGTEYYHSESVGATENSSVTFTEYPNCSADITYVKNDVKITANWTLIDEKTTGSFKYCNEKGCHEREW